jgi:hypothetical protein
MATATIDKPARTRKPRKSTVPTVCQLVLFIGGVSYHVKPIRSDFHHKAFSLRKPDGTVYHVAEGEHGAECDCPAATYRDAPCRHLRALSACTLIGDLPRTDT